MAEKPPPQTSRASTLRKEVNHLKRVLAEKTRGSRFFQRCLAKSRGSTPAEQQALARRHLRRNPGSDADARQLEYRANVSAGRSEPGGLLSLPAGAQPDEEDMEVRSAIQQIALEHRRRYGYRRISAELRRRGMLVNHKRVARIMREDNLLAVQPRQFVVTTDSDHELEVYLESGPAHEANGD